MMKKAAVMFVLLVLISSLADGQEITEDPYQETETCVGFWGKVK